MFTGIIEETGILKKLEMTGSAVMMLIECKKVLEGTIKGDSIAVDGICVTVSGLGSSWFSADIMPETLRRTSLREVAIPRRVNLERALIVSGRLGGHIVNGHVDAAGTITGRKAEGNAILLTVEVPANIMRYIVEKGSVAVDGTSLTVAHTEPAGFTVSLIPATSGFTTLGSRLPGDRVNIECDILGKYIEKLLGLKNPALNTTDTEGKLSLEFLRENGFL